MTGTSGRRVDCPPMKRNDQSEHLSGEDARAGEKRHEVRYILYISLALIIVLFAIITATGMFSSESPVNNANAPASDSPRARGQ
jgi:hypothetical protein